MSLNVADTGVHLLTELDHYLHLVHLKIVGTYNYEPADVSSDGNHSLSSEFSRVTRELLEDNSLSEVELQRLVDTLQNTVNTFQTIGMYFGASSSARRSNFTGCNV